MTAHHDIVFSLGIATWSNCWFFFNEEEFDLRIQTQGGGKQFCFVLIREQGMHVGKVTYLPTRFNYNDEY